MSERILIGVAWPYANCDLHLGHVAGAYLPADIFARYNRAAGNEVLMVSGSDQHGTPVTISAEKENTTPKEVAAKYHESFCKSWEQLGISWDLFTTTETDNHKKVSQDIFLKLLKNGYLYKESVKQFYCSSCKRFLPDRYVEGVCPNCGAPGARGDQCDSCGKPLNGIDLKQPRCKICSTVPEIKESEHFFLKLSAFQDDLLAWVSKQKEEWRPNVQRFTQRYLEEGLHDRAITRDLDWGIPLPLDGYDGKCLYVWFEAVIGYFSASIEWAERKGDKDAWKPFWLDKSTKAYYFIGKDNIPFHTIIWPAMLMGYGDLNLPYDVPANEFLTIESQKFSKSRNLAIWVKDYFERYSADPLRYLLSINMPETGDADFSWKEFVRRNNDELVATYGNLAQRVLTLTYKNFDGKVPEKGELDEASENLIKLSEEAIVKVGELLSHCHFKDAIRETMDLAHAANKYLDDAEPWKVIKVDKEKAGSSLYTAICVIAALKTMFYPFLPFSSQKLHEYLGFDGKVEDAGWKIVVPQEGQQLRQPSVLFTKLDEKIVDEERERMGIG
jgi:methionyl-tRNA synthetase